MEEASQLLDMDGLVVPVEKGDVQLLVAARHDHVPVLVLLQEGWVLERRVA